MIKKIFSIVLLLFIFVLTIGCSNKELSAINNDKKELTKQEFEESDNFWTQDQADLLIQESKLGNTPENALVPLVFNELNILHSPESFNKLLDTEAEIETYFTNLSTFQLVTNSQNLIDSVEGLGIIFTYDPYTKEINKKDLEVPEIEKILKSRPSK